MREFKYYVRTAALPLDDYDEIEELSDDEIAEAITSFLAGYDCYDNFSFEIINNYCIAIYLDRSLDMYEGDLV